MNPLNLSGSAFLLLWAIGWSVVIGFAHVVRRSWMRPRAAGDVALHPTEVAFLVGGTRRAVEAAVVGLEHRGIAKVDIGDRIDIVGPRRKRIERAGVYRGIVEDEPLSEAEHHVMTFAPATMTELVNAPVLEAQLTDKLVGAQLLVGDRGRKWLALWALPLAWWSVGLAKVAVGVGRERPVGFLLLLFALAMWLVPKTLRVPRLTDLGASVVAKLVAHNRGLETTAKASPQLVDAADLTLAYALFGPVILADSLAAIMPSYAARAIGCAGGGASCASSCGDASGGASCGASCGGGCGGCS